MRAIVKGKVYDTSTAAAIAGAESIEPQCDFHFWRERLYRTQKGAWFLAAEGGALSQWADNGYGRRIVPMSANDVLRWAEKHQIQACVIERHLEVEEA